MSGFAERGGRFALSGVQGRDPRTGELAESAEEQFRLAFEAVSAQLAEHGLTPGEVGRVTVFIPGRELRPLINSPWLAMFPDDADRPARRTTHAPLLGPVRVELDVVGVRGARRRSVEVPGIRHRDPLPMGARLGPHLFSSVIPPDVPGGGTVTGEAAIEQVFRNAAALVTEAGGSPRDVHNVWVYLGMWDLHPEMVDTWVAAFPDEATRPTRKTFHYPGVDIQLQLEAVVGASRGVYEIDGLGHHDPIPMAAHGDALFATSGVDGRVPATGELPRGVAAQTAQAWANVTALVAQAGGSERDLFHVTALMGDARYAAAVDEVWSGLWNGAGGAAPALQHLVLGLPARDTLVQFVAEGVLPARSGGAS